MNSGLDCSDWDERSPGHEEKMYDSRDWIRFMLDLRMLAAPGAQASYCTGGVVLLGHVVSQRSGLALDAYAQQWLLGPLNIQDSVWRRAADGRTTGGTGFGLRPRDAAKLGALFANEGEWNGVRVVSGELGAAHQPASGHAGFTGLWLPVVEDAASRMATGRSRRVFTAGNGGNFIFIVPSQELVVAFTGSNYNAARSDTPYQLMPLVLSALPVN